MKEKKEQEQRLYELLCMDDQFSSDSDQRSDNESLPGQIKTQYAMNHKLQLDIKKENMEKIKSKKVSYCL